MLKYMPVNCGGKSIARYAISKLLSGRAPHSDFKKNFNAF